MSGRKKVIGVCVAKIQTEERREYLAALHRIATSNGYKLLVFTSVFEDSDEAKESGSWEVYRRISFEKLSALVIYRYISGNIKMLDNMVRIAQDRDIPVILINDEGPNCYSIYGRFEKPFKDLIRHLIRDHQVRDPFFIAGRSTNDVNSERRYACFKEVLKEYGMPIREDRFAYGGYWEYPTNQVIDRIVNSGDPIPDAFVCANDLMAVSVIKRLNGYGIRVPEDVLVTGFDGLECARFSDPPLATCYENLESAAEQTIEVVRMAGENTMRPGRIYYNYKDVRNVSCGCRLNMVDMPPASGADLFLRIRNTDSNIFFSEKFLDRVVSNPCLGNLLDSLPYYLLPGRFFCFRENLWDNVEYSEEERKRLPDELELFYLSEEGESKHRIIDLSRESIPFWDSWMKDDTLMVISAVSQGDLCCGLAYYVSSNIHEEASEVHRNVRTINRAINSAYAGENILNISRRLDMVADYDVITETYNMDGLLWEYTEMMKDPECRNSYISIGVYQLMTLNTILEENGTEASREVLRFIAKSLRFANGDRALIGRTGTDCFTVITIYDSPLERKQGIDEAVRLFFGVIDVKAGRTLKEIPINVSCGYSDQDPHGKSNLDSYISLAMSALYRNRVDQGLEKTPDFQTDIDASLARYREVFTTLVDENLFQYHYQPIVSARDGQVVAYEALMRTSAQIGLNPLEILSLADAYGRLLDIERATVKNVLEQFKRQSSEFGGCSIFINTIPGYTLPTEERDSYRKKYAEYMPRVVMEITETASLSRGEVELLRGKDGEGLVRIAIDDYGTGHSNVVNLLEYRPEIVKIDRYLISGIDADPNKQLFVKNLIEFAKANQIQVLAEGVETEEELRTVVKFGVDLLQGYYLAKPAAEIRRTISEEVKQQILDCRENELKLR